MAGDHRPRPTHTVIVPSTAHAFQVIGTLLQNGATFTVEPGTNGVWHLGVMPGAIELLAGVFGPITDIDPIPEDDPSQLSTYTIYENPTDIPEARFAVRQFTTQAGQSWPGKLLGTAATLPEARAFIPAQADTRFPRQDEDDGAIVETWM
jgi:hypothetical protein